MFGYASVGNCNLPEPLPDTCVDDSAMRRYLGPNVWKAGHLIGWGNVAEVFRLIRLSDELLETSCVVAAEAAVKLGIPTPAKSFRGEELELVKAAKKSVRDFVLWRCVGLQGGLDMSKTACRRWLEEICQDVDADENLASQLVQAYCKNIEAIEEKGVNRYIREQQLLREQEAPQEQHAEETPAQPPQPPNAEPGMPAMQRQMSQMIQMLKGANQRLRRIEAQVAQVQTQQDGDQQLQQEITPYGAEDDDDNDGDDVSAVSVRATLDEDEQHAALDDAPDNHAVSVAEWRALHTLIEEKANEAVDHNESGDGDNDADDDDDDDDVDDADDDDDDSSFACMTPRAWLGQELE